MPGNRKHIVKTMCFDIEVSDEATAAAFSDRLRAVDCEMLLNTALEKYDKLKDTIIIDRIELDIGSIVPDEVDAIGSEITRQLEASLSHLLHSEFYRVSSAAAHETAKTGIGSLRGNVAETDLEVLMHYLRTGSLPWNIIDSPDMEEMLLNIAHTDTASFIKFLTPELSSNIVIERIATIFKYSTVVLILRNFLDEGKFLQTEKLTAALTEHLSFSLVRNVKKGLASVYLSLVSSSVQQIQNYIDAFIVFLKPVLGSLSISALETIQENIQILISSVSDDRLTCLFENIQRIVLQRINEENGTVDNDLNSRAGQEAKNGLINPAKLENIPEDEDIGKNDRFEEQQYHFLDNAGLALINWGFIQNSLAQLGWVKDRQIADEQSRNKILIWMDYLVWGQRRIHEYGLTLNKVLLGMQPSDVADIHELLTGQEKRAADELLKAVIEHWSRLKNTSIDGLRASFLQRNGRLSDDDGGWQMHVESKGIDILIESLPWTYSIVKTPWMEKPLFTQWSTKA